MAELRPSQKKVLEYTHGRMGISAVPGSGKTFTLSRLAFQLVYDEQIKDEQEVLIVTFTNAAVDNFNTRIASLMSQHQLIPGVGYRVRTLHGLAHDIVRERPDLAGLSEHFVLLDERERDEMLDKKVENWIAGHPEFIHEWVARKADGQPLPIKTDTWKKLLLSLAISFIRQAKDMRKGPADIRKRMEERNYCHSLLQFGLDIFSEYQKELALRRCVDFDDLIQLALQVIQSDGQYLRRLQHCWPYILEDEAQDSSLLQQEILETLCGENGNWVRVGDPNQAIYETFTTASPQHLRDFMKQPGVIARNLPESGRFSKNVMELANYLVRWTREEHPVTELRDSLSYPPIEPPPPGDEQYPDPNRPGNIHISSRAYSPEDEVTEVVKSIQRNWEDLKDQTIAILAHKNDRGLPFIEALKRANIKAVELLSTNQATRAQAEVLSAVLRYLSNPDRNETLVTLFKKVHLKQLQDSEQKALFEQAARLLGQCKSTENYVSPRPGEDWLASRPPNVPGPVLQELDSFRQLLRKWQEAALLPVDQLVLTIAQDLYAKDHEHDNGRVGSHVELALAHQLARVLERRAETHPEWRLRDYANELTIIAKDSIRLQGFQEEDSGFDPKQHKGEVVVTTIHKAKGLEWDRVYLTSANNYDFPSAEPYDVYFAEKKYVKGKLNLQAEALAKLKALFGNRVEDLFVEDGEATLNFRYEYCAERLRLFYVAITRACKDLVITFNTGGEEGVNLRACLPLLALKAYWEKKA